jgi:hypothetical protein
VVFHISCWYQNPTFHRYIHRRPLTTGPSSQSVLSIPTHYIFPQDPLQHFHPRSPNFSLPFRLSGQNLCAVLDTSQRATYPTRLNSSLTDVHAELILNAVVPFRPWRLASLSQRIWAFILFFEMSPRLKPNTEKRSYISFNVSLLSCRFCGGPSKSSLLFPRLMHEDTGLALRVGELKVASNCLWYFTKNY